MTYGLRPIRWQLIKEAQQFKADLQAVFVINRKIVNTAIGRDVNKALANFDLPVCERAPSQRVIYAESAARGLTVIEIEADSAAAKEIIGLARSLSNMKIKQAKVAV
jgi:chromosome partitioning protein